MDEKGRFVLHGGLQTGKQSVIINQFYDAKNELKRSDGRWGGRRPPGTLLTDGTTVRGYHKG